MSTYEGGNQGGGGDGTDSSSGDGDGGVYEGGNQGGGDETGNGFELPQWLSDLESASSTLSELGKNPVGFIVGAVLSTFLGGVQTLIEAFVDAILFLALGSDYTISATGTLGIADIPVFAVSLVTSSAGTFAGALTTVIREFNRAAVGVATTAGPLSPVVYAGILAAAMIASAWTLRTLIGVVADAVPGLEGIIG